MIDLKEILAKHSENYRQSLAVGRDGNSAAVRGMHVLAAMKEACELLVDECKKNSGFIQTTSEKLNTEEYKPFITADDNTLWTIDVNSIEQVKQLIK